MFVEHRAAFSSALYGTLALVLFLAPYFLYLSEYHDADKQAGGQGRTNSGDIVSILTQGLGIHIVLLFLFTVGFEIIDIIMNAVPALKPSEGIKNFFLMQDGSFEKSAFIQKWISANLTNAAVSPLGQIANKSFAIFLVAMALLVSVLFFILPMAILVLSIKYALNVPGEEQESFISAIGKGTGFFIATTALVYIHATIADTLVIVLTGETDFSFFKAMQSFWHLLLFGGDLGVKTL